MDPELLLTQQSQSVNPNDVFGLISVKGKSFADSNRYRSSASNDLETIVSQIQSAVSHGSESSNANSQVLSGKQNTLSDILGRKTSIPDRKSRSSFNYSNWQQSSYNSRDVKSSAVQSETKQFGQENIREKSLVHCVGLSSLEKERNCNADESETRYSFVKAIAGLYDALCEIAVVYNL